MRSHCDSISGLEDMEDSRVILIGDYNMPHIDWTNVQNLSNQLPRERRRSFRRFGRLIDDVRFQQYNSHPNVNDRILDLVLSHVELETRAVVPLVREDLHHRAIVITLIAAIQDEDSDIDTSMRKLRLDDALEMTVREAQIEAQRLAQIGAQREAQIEEQRQAQIEEQRQAQRQAQRMAQRGRECPRCGQIHEPCSIL